MSYSLATPSGTISVPDAVLGRLVVVAAELVEGARVRRPKRGVDVAVAGGRVRVEVELAARRGSVLPDLGRAVQESVAAALRRSCGLEASAVDVRIEELEP